MAARLKVFTTSDGLTDYVIATSSRAKALAAWGVHQDLFKTGGAEETDVPAIRDEAMARPDEVLRRPAGSRAALARVRSRPKPKPKKPSNALLHRIEVLEGRLSALADQRAADEAQEAAARAKREAEAAKALATYQRRAETLRDQLREARRRADL